MIINRNEMDLLGTIGHEFFNDIIERAQFSPSFDTTETDSAFIITADIPGVGEDNLAIQTKDNVITISGSRTFETKGRRTAERTAGKFSRSFKMPRTVNLDDIQARLSNGVLTISIPKKPEIQPRSIKIISS